MTETNEKARRVVAYCMRNGVIGFAGQAPRGSITLTWVTWDEEARLRDVISSFARLAYDNETFLIPGVPEAADDEEASRRVWDFQEELLSRLDAPTGATNKAAGKEGV